MELPDLETFHFQKALFSGGTGRSGTTIIGRLLSRHSKIALSKPAEIKFLTSGNGLLDLHLGRKVGRYKRLLVTDRLHLERFKYRLRNDWWEREAKTGGAAGLLQGLTMEELDLLCDQIRNTFGDSKLFATRQFMSNFIDMQLGATTKTMWIDTTPINLYRAAEISEFLPGSRFIHMVRDGRDVISSVIRERWGPKDYESGLAWYRKRMHRILENSVKLQDRVLTLSIENLVINEREKSIHKLLSFLELHDENRFREFFDSALLESSVSRGRWQTEVRNLKEFNAAYADLVTELKEIDPTVPLEI